MGRQKNPSRPRCWKCGKLWFPDRIAALAEIARVSGGGYRVAPDHEQPTRAYPAHNGWHITANRRRV